MYLNQLITHLISIKYHALPSVLSALSRLLSISHAKAFSSSIAP